MDKKERTGVESRNAGVARRAHNPKVVGSIPTKVGTASTCVKTSVDKPATKKSPDFLSAFVF